MSDFEKWFVDQDFYTNMRFIYGENLFHKDLGVYRILPVQMTFKAWEGQKAKLDNMEQCYIEKKKELEDQQKRIDAGLEKIRQFGKEGCLFPEWLTWAEKALRGEHE